MRNLVQYLVAGIGLGVFWFALVRQSGGIMPRVEAVRAEVQRLMHAAPFRPFALNLENGDRVVIEHPENIAFDPANAEGAGGSEDFYVISGRLRLFSTFGAVASVALLDQGGVAE
jgi:hypothetical protein